MSKRLIEELSGIGEIRTGDIVLRSTAYRLAVWADEGPDGSADHGPVTIDGHIDIDGIAEAVVLTGPDSLALALEDGRRLAFSVTDTGGRIVGRGGLQAP
jgi:hypothetical protein